MEARRLKSAPLSKMNRADLIKWIDDYEAAQADIAKFARVNVELAADNAKLAADNRALSALVAAQEAIIADLKAAGGEDPERAALKKKYSRVRFIGKCTLRQFTQAAYSSMYVGKLPNNWQGLFEAYYSELEKPFGLEKNLTHVIGAMPAE